MRSGIAFCVLVSTVILASASALAQSGGPDFWDVAGVRADDKLNLRSQPKADSRILARIPPKARGLKNLGCVGLPSFEQWSRMTAAERTRAARARWCKVAYNDTTGWVAGRFLRESVASTPAGSVRQFGKWAVRCSPSCSLEQTATGAGARTIFRIDQRQGENARISILRATLPQTGTLAFYADGELISQGPITPFLSKDGRSLVMQPDDLTANLVKRMQEGKTLVVSFPGEERGIEIELDNFIDGWRELGG